MEVSRRNFLKTGVTGAAALTVIPASTIPAFAACVPSVWDLTAGQTKIVGTLSVTNDAKFVYVTYTLNSPQYPAYFGTLHLWVRDDLANVPKNNPGNPIPGQFPFQHTPTDTATTTYTFAIPFADLGMSGPIKDYCDRRFYVVAHAEVNYVDANGNPTGEGDTAFGGPTPGPTGNRWWFYGTYYICCDVVVDPPTPPRVNTAFAKGNYLGDADTADHWVFTTDPKSNPQNLPSLGLIRNRWGWAIRIRDNQRHEFDLWAGCGLNKLSSGQKVGTVVMRWDGSQLYVKYDTFDGPLPTAIASLREVHVYAGDGQPTTIAPGQYGNLEYFNPPRDWWDTYINVTDTDGDGIWVIAHAVVQY